MNYTKDQKELLYYLLGTRIAPHTKSPSLRMSLLKASEHMFDDTLSESDLILLNSALELIVTNTPEDGSKESWTELIELLVVTRHMLNAASTQQNTE